MDLAILFLMVTVFVAGILFFCSEPIENTINKWLRKCYRNSPSKLFRTGNSILYRKLNKDFVSDVKIISLMYFIIGSMVLIMILLGIKSNDPYMERTHSCVKVYDSVTEKWV